MGSHADNARVVLATIRLVNGLAALLAPRQMARRFGVDPDEQPALVYLLRLFGIRTFALGLALLAPDQEVRTRELRRAPLLHASDALVALIAGVRHQLPARAALMTVTTSAVNTCLALIAQRSRHQPPGAV
ncbi:MAG TPA: DUF4267 domain-containing protein [Chloroflexota bacterium]|nr:DUF4267 domain-containing protein [Chloroflexota bacterium]